MTSLASFCLQLPGKQLNLSALLAKKKFRGKGNKDAAVAAFQELEKVGLGELISEGSSRGTSKVCNFSNLRIILTTLITRCINLSKILLQMRIWKS